MSSPRGTAPDHLTAEWVTVTPEMAAEWLETHNTDNRQRRTKPQKDYAREMENGHWRTTGDPIRFGDDGVLYDGQHRLTAQVQTGTTLVHLVIRGLTKEDRDALDQGARRTPADVLGFHGVDKYRHQVGSTLRLLDAWDAGLITHAGSGATPSVTGGEIRELLEFYPEAMTHQPWAKSVGKDLGLSQGALTASRCIQDRQALEEDVEAFWAGVEGRDVMAKGDPRMTLRKWARTRTPLPNGRMDSSHQLYAIFTAWNRWRAGETLTSIRPVKSQPVFDADTGRLVKPAEYRAIPKPR